MKLSDFPDEFKRLSVTTAWWQKANNCMKLMEQAAGVRVFKWLEQLARTRVSMYADDVTRQRHYSATSVFRPPVVTNFYPTFTTVNYYNYNWPSEPNVNGTDDYSTITIDITVGEMAVSCRLAQYYKMLSIEATTSPNEVLYIATSSSRLKLFAELTKQAPDAYKGYLQLAHFMKQNNVSESVILEAGKQLGYTGKSLLLARYKQQNPFQFYILENSIYNNYIATLDSNLAWRSNITVHDIYNGLNRNSYKIDDENTWFDNKYSCLYDCISSCAYHLSNSNPIDLCMWLEEIVSMAWLTGNTLAVLPSDCA